MTPCPHVWVLQMIPVFTGTGSYSKPGATKCTLCGAFKPPEQLSAQDYDSVRHSVRDDFRALQVKLDEVIAENKVLREGPEHEYYRDLIHRLCREISTLNDELKLLSRKTS